LNRLKPRYRRPVIDDCKTDQKQLWGVMKKQGLFLPLGGGKTGFTFSSHPGFEGETR